MTPRRAILVRPAPAARSNVSLMRLPVAAVNLVRRPVAAVANAATDALRLPSTLANAVSKPTSSSTTANTAAKPPMAQSVANQAIATSKAHDATTKMDSSVQRLMASARKNKKLGSKVTAIANALSKKSGIVKQKAAQIQAARSKM